MPTKAAVSVEEYLRTSFPDVDREYVDGEILERSLPDLCHSNTQGNLYYYFRWRERQIAAFAYPELRLRMASRVFRVADICVFHPDRPTERVPSTPPLIVIEVLSPDDKLHQVREKLQEYRSWGVRHVWLIDPESRRMYDCEDALAETQVLKLPELALELSPNDVFGDPTPA